MNERLKEKNDENIREYESLMYMTYNVYLLTDINVNKISS